MNLAKSIIQEAIIPFESEFLKAFKTSVSEVCENLFDKARVASSNEEEQDVYSQYRLLKNTSDALIQFVKVYAGDMPRGMLHMTESGSEEAEDSSLLSIVGHTELDIVLAYSQLESLLNVRFYSQLFLLEKRNKALFSQQPLDKTTSPFSPHSVSWVLKKILAHENFSANTQIMIINQMAANLSATLEETYAQINQIYIDYRILPNLKPLVRNQTSRSGVIEQQKEVNNAEAVSSPINGELATSETKEKTGQVPVINDSLEQDGFNPRQLSDQKLYQLFSMMSALQGTESSAKQAVNISHPVLDQSLAEMKWAPEGVFGVKNRESFKSALNNQITDSTGINQPVIETHQEQAIDLMAHIFDQISADERIDQNILPSISQLQVPLLRSAIKDNQFFESESHPARQFLEKVLSASYYWHGTQVVNDIEKFSNLVSRDYDGNSDTFERVYEDLEKYLQMVQTKAENAEKKYRAKVKGRERLKSIHQFVDKFIGKLLNINDIGLIKHLLEYVLKDTLTLTLLREGKNSEEWEVQSNMVKNIVRMTHVKHHTKLNDSQIKTVLKQLENNMYNLGFAKTDVDLTVDELVTYHKKVKEQKIALDGEKQLDEEREAGTLSLFLIEEAFAHLKDSAETDKGEKNKRLDEIRPLNDEERQMMEKVKRYPFGSFFDFKLEADDERRKKMCWLSPVSNFALFVNPLGRKPLEKPIPELAIEMVAGEVEYIRPESRGFFSRAINRVYEKIKQMKSGLTSSKTKSDE